MAGFIYHLKTEDVTDAVIAEAGIAHAFDGNLDIGQGDA